MTASREETKRGLLMTISATQGFNAWLGIEDASVTDGGDAVEFSVPVRSDMMQHQGFVHGGVIGAVADVGLAWAAAEIDADVRTQTYTLQFLRPAGPGTLVVRGEVVRRGRQAVAVRAVVCLRPEGGDAVEVAHAMATIWRVERQNTQRS